MSSKIQEALALATEVEPSKRKNETITAQDYLKRLAVAVGELSDEDWAKIPVDAQDWYNLAADAISAKKDVPEFPDMPKAETSNRRRGAAAPAPAPPPWGPAKNDKVEVVTKRGRTYVGQILEIDADGLVLDVEGKDVELDRDKIDSLKLDAPITGLVTTARSEPEPPADPEVGDTVQVVTKRGKTIMGNVKELTDDDIVLEDATGEFHELSKDKLTSIVVKSRGAAGAGVASTKATATSSADENKDKKKITAAMNGGVSVTVRMRELICAHMDDTKDAVAARLQKENLDFKKATLDLTYADTHKVIGILRHAGKLR